MRIRSLLTYLTIMPVVIGCNRSGIVRSDDTARADSISIVEEAEQPYVPAFLVNAGAGSEWPSDTLCANIENVGEIAVPLTRSGMELLHLPHIVMDSSEVASDCSIGIIGWQPLGSGKCLVGFQPDEFGSYVSGYIGMYDTDGRLADVLYVDRWYDSYWETGADDKMSMSGYQWSECIAGNDTAADSSFKVVVHIREQYYEPEEERVDSCVVTYRYHVAGDRIVYDGNEFDTGSYGTEMTVNKDVMYELQWDVWPRPLSDPQVLDMWDRLIRKYGIGEVAMRKDVRCSFVWQAYASDPKRFWTWVYDHRDDENAALLNMLQNIFVHDTTLTEDRVRSDIQSLTDPVVRECAFSGVALLDGF